MSYGSGLMDVVQSSTTGVAPQFNDGSGAQIGTLARAWVNFGYVASAITIRASFNISSVTRTSTGIYAVNFTNASSDANYSVVGIGSSPGTSNSWLMLATPTPTTTSFSVQTLTNSSTLADSTYVTLSVFR